MEYYPSFFPETALALLQALLYSMACVLAGAALIAVESAHVAPPRPSAASTKLAEAAPLVAPGLPDRRLA